MRRFFNYLILATAVHAAAQITPPPMAAFTYSGSSWVAAVTSATGGALGFTPPPAALYCYNSSLGQWVPADSSCFGGGGAYLPLSGGTMTGPINFGTLGSIFNNALSTGYAFQQYTDQGTGLGTYNMSLGSFPNTPNSSVPNEVFNIGWNVNAAGAPTNPAFPMVRLAMEDNYCPSTYCQSEFHWAAQPPSTATRPGAIRFLTGYQRNDTGYVGFQLDADSIQFENPTDASGNVSQLWTLLNGTWESNNSVDNTEPVLMTVPENASYGGNMSLIYRKDYQDIFWGGTNLSLRSQILTPGYATFGPTRACTYQVAGGTTMITDSTVGAPGAPITVGGGTLNVLAYCDNGTNKWRVERVFGGSGVGATTSGLSNAMVAGTVTVSTASACAISGSACVYQFTHCVPGGTMGTLSVGTVTAGTSFVVNSTSGTDTSQICWRIN